jgi:CheY-like chemotaxis protein
MQTLLGGWGCRVLKADNLAAALAAIEGSGLEPDGLLVDYHLDGANGIGVIAELRRRHGGNLVGNLGGDHGQDLGRDLAAILVTADRSLHVREEARAAGVHVLNKPVKPASLRALITQWRVQRVAAE